MSKKSENSVKSMEKSNDFFVLFSLKNVKMCYNRLV